MSLCPELQIPVFIPFMAPPLWWYRALAAAEVAVLDAGVRYDKRVKDMHRFLIETRKGPANVTVPVSRAPDTLSLDGEYRRLQWADMQVSAHDRWWLQTASTLATVYGPSPYYDFVMPEFRRFFSEEAVGMPVVQYNLEMDALVRRLLNLPTRITCALPCESAHIQMQPVTRPAMDTPVYSILHYLFMLGPEETRRQLMDCSDSSLSSEG